MAATATRAHKLGAWLVKMLDIDGASDPAALSAWTGTTSIAKDAFRRSTGSNGWAYKCIVAGTTGGSEPTWPTTADATVTDGSVVWQAVHKGVKASLFSTLTFDPDTHDFYDDIAASELATANGYTNGGKCITDGKLGSYDATNDRTPYTADPTTWTASGSAIAARYLVIRIDRGTDALSPIVQVEDYGSLQSAAAGTDWKARYNSADADGAVFYI